MDDSLISKIKDSFAAQSMMRTLGAELSVVTSGHVEIRAPVLPGSRQQQGYGHAGLTFAIGDSAAGYAALTMMPIENEVLTAEMKINLLSPAQGDFLAARGRVLKPGRRLIVVASDVFAITDDRETHIAALQGTMVPVTV